MAVICLFAKPMPKYSIVGNFADTSQALIINRHSLTHVSRYRQSTPWAAEAGGQLFGTLTATRICVTEASGPYPGDKRSRNRYRSNPATAQREIEQRRDRGLLYLGEWHTHAEDYPDASELDYAAMRSLLISSQLNSNMLLMMIVGRAQSTAGFGAWRISIDITRRAILSKGV